MLSAGANVDLVDKHGQTALFEVAIDGHLEILRILLQAKADANLVNKKGLSALHLSAGEGHTEIV